ncbi:hypothetical protein QBC37DRAFT_405473 [Rhypophila decipiens]|uniref:Caspase domain-containing protein n=1 Tax=Rhypophila decipiens TaxID=261697 RepID=A0AAN7B0J6_9PEZI|nr:hypothetical protein QBC37DRAFT_405473 [Rhypophila decipiens]
MASTSTRPARTPSPTEYTTSKIFTLKWNHSYDDPDPQAPQHQARNVRFDADVIHDRDNLKVILHDTFGVTVGTDYIVRRKRNFLGIKQPYTAEPVVQAINADARGLGNQDLFVFYYSGYGEHDNRQGLAFANNKPGRFILASPILAALRALPCDVLVILDCCNAVNTSLPPPTGPSNKRMMILGASLSTDLTTADSTRTMTNRLRKVLRTWATTNNNELRIAELGRLINRSTAELQRSGDTYVRDVVIQDYTGRGDITLGRG